MAPPSTRPTRRPEMKMGMHTSVTAPTTSAPKPAKNHAAFANTTSSVALCHAKWMQTCR